MNKKEVRKNLLDLRYKKHLQIQNVTLLLGTISVIPLIISFIWYKERLILGFILTLIIGFISYIWYKKSDKRLNNILNRIKDI